MRGLALASVALVLSGCPDYRRAPEPIPVPRGACEQAEAKLRELRCTREKNGEQVPLWRPYGSPFAKECHIAAADGRPWHPECLAKIRDCAEFSDRYWGRLCD